MLASPRAPPAGWRSAGVLFVGASLRAGDPAPPQVRALGGGLPWVTGFTDRDGSLVSDDNYLWEAQRDRLSSSPKEE